MAALNATSCGARPLLEWWDAFPGAAERERFPHDAVCCRAEWDTPAPPDADFMEAVLSPDERKTWIEMRAVEKRRREWLLGRAVAKDALCRVIARHTSTRLSPRDVEIVPDAYGCPHARGAWRRQLAVEPIVSIAHSEGTAVALAALGPEWLAGIDLESVDHRRQDFESVAFSAPERALLARLEPELRPEWALRMWCAKEALAKALGRGLSAGLLSFQIPQLETGTGKVLVQWRGMTAVVYTTREARFVFAAILCRRGTV
jgi:phosphopantetheinyl transferase